MMILNHRTIKDFILPVSISSIPRRVDLMTEPESDPVVTVTVPQANPHMRELGITRLVITDHLLKVPASHDELPDLMGCNSAAAKGGLKAFSDIRHTLIHIIIRMEELQLVARNRIKQLRVHCRALRYARSLAQLIVP